MKIYISEVWEDELGGCSGALGGVGRVFLLLTKCLCFPPILNSYVETLTPNMLVFEDGAFGKQLGSKGKVPMNGIRAFIRRDR